MGRGDISASTVPTIGFTSGIGGRVTPLAGSCTMAGDVLKISDGVSSAEVGSGVAVSS